MKKAIYLISLPLILILFWGFNNGGDNISPQVAPFSYSLPDTALVKPKAIHPKKAVLVAGLINYNHYGKKNLNDELSSILLDRYLKALDNNKLYFLSSDIKRFEGYRYHFDDFLQEGKLDAPYEIFNIYKQRRLERLHKNIKLLEKKYDFTSEEYLESDREESNWVTSEEQQDELWRKMVKNSLLSLIISGKEGEESKKLLKTRYENQIKAITQMNSEDVFEVYMNALTESYDPHTTYFSPIEAQNFNMRMNKSFEGIGARLSTDGDYTTIHEVMPGGPAFKSKKLQANDKIVGVGQGKDGDFVDVVGWRTEDVVGLIRGDKGTVVRLQIIPAGEASNTVTKVVTLIRDKIKIEEQSASKRVIQIQKKDKNYKLGVITIPSFYINFEEYRAGKKDYKSTSNDVKKLLVELQKEKIDGLIIDLRYNGGGSLKEAIDLTGLFIKKGPVVQVRDTKGKISLHRDTDESKIYGGPLALMVNGYSASASEIFSGAIQDYERGIIIGEQTYGKGTVQSPIDLTNYMQDASEALGQLNLTISKYYRVTGSSTQHLGVVPDLKIPSWYDQDEIGESSEPTALPWDEIKAASFTKEKDVSEALIDKLQKSYKKRLKTDENLQELITMITELREFNERTRISLNKKIREEESKDYEDKQKARTKLFEKDTSGDVTIKDVKDPYLYNSLQILLEMIFDKNGIAMKN